MRDFPGIGRRTRGPRRSTRHPDSSTPAISGLAQTFVDRRLALRLTQQRLADLSGVSRYSVQSLERGDDSIRISSVLALADVLGLRLTAGAGAE
ncbi:MAG: helix-turn-helix transcriptional regulator [Mycobacterium sp.]|nr:helix-turn-helix transcriptional regulator [Mycobacterium sp.]